MKTIMFVGAALAAFELSAINVVNDSRPPITAIWTGAGGNFMWTNDLNWAGGVAPGSSLKKDGDGGGPRARVAAGGRQPRAGIEAFASDDIARALKRRNAAGGTRDFYTESMR